MLDLTQRRSGRLTPLVLAAILMLTAAVAAPGASAASGPVTGPFVRAGKWIVDREGRVVVLHGFDIVKKDSPYYPSSFTANDAGFLAREGVTVARIGFIWAGVEPEPGVYDDAYIEDLVKFNELLEHDGIHTLIDFHQDGFGTVDETPASECSSDGVCDIASGDGAPSWAMLGSSADEDFQDFWNNDRAPDGVGIQTHFIDAWEHVVRILDASPGASNILGFDPFNEPYPGSGYPSPCGDYAPCPAFEDGALYSFYTKVIAAIRLTGDHHMIFPEGIAQNAQAVPSLPAFSDPETGFNWHYYCTESQVIPDVTGEISGQFCPATDATAHANILKYTSQLDVPWLVSEFGGNDADPEYADEVDWMGSQFLSWMEWMYYQALTDPANIPGQGLLTVDALGGSEANANQQKLDALVVPYAEAIAGTPESYAFDRSTDTMTLNYLATAVPGARLARRALTRIFVPERQYPLGYQLQVTGGREVTQSGQWVQVAAAHQGADITVTITSDSSLPTDLAAPPY